MAPEDAVSSKTRYLHLASGLRKTLDGPFNIEILPRSHQNLIPFGQNVLMEEGGIALPKHVLVDAFVYAAKLLFRWLEEKDANVSYTNRWSYFDVSSVVLLYDPEHITAINARKKAILAFEAASYGEGFDAVCKDLYFTQNLLVSHMPKHVKSPNLWAHRRWLASRRLKHAEIWWHSELQIVSLAADRHPRNYHAWSYLRWFFEVYSGGLLALSRQIEVPTARYAGRNEGWPSIVAYYQDWCADHPSDISGWTFLLFLLNREECRTQDNIWLLEQVAKDTLWEVKTFKRDNESMWVFLRALMTSDSISSETREEFVDDAMEALTDDKPEGQRSRVCRAALNWFEKHKLSPEQ